LFLKELKIELKELKIELPHAGQEATVRTGHGTTDWLQTGKGVQQAVYSHPAYLTYIPINTAQMLPYSNTYYLYYFR